MSMTPERIKHIATKHELMDCHTLQQVTKELLAALEETQQTIARQSAALGWYELGKPELARAALGEGAKEEACCPDPQVTTVNNEFVSNTTVCINCGRLFREGAKES